MARRRRWGRRPPPPPEPRGDFPPSAPKLPPPDHGIRVRRIGATWWGERWVGSLYRFGSAYAHRLDRGRGYARQGRVHDLAVTAGVVTASVTGSRPTPYAVRLALRPLDDRAWAQAINAMAGRARFAAQLLAGEMPRDIEGAFASARASLFPVRRADLQTECTCPDPANPCKHIAAVHFVLGEAFDRDPFLLFELRGRSKESVLGALRERRRQAAVRRAAGRPAAPPETPVPAAAVPAGPVAYEAFRQSVDDLRFRITETAPEGAVLRHLGPPPGWTLPVPFGEAVQPALARAAARAREIALAATAEPRA
jgi:uncharacterized Zn finger protein